MNLLSANTYIHDMMLEVTAPKTIVADLGLPPAIVGCQAPNGDFRKPDDSNNGKGSAQLHYNFLHFVQS